MLGVCRARMSEGIDFSDDAARMVIVVGIPYPNLTDPKIILRRNYLEQRFRR
jgi:Rad3-related DNA helicase